MLQLDLGHVIKVIKYDTVLLDSYYPFFRQDRHEILMFMILFLVCF